MSPDMVRTRASGVTGEAGMEPAEDGAGEKDGAAGGGVGAMEGRIGGGVGGTLCGRGGIGGGVGGIFWGDGGTRGFGSIMDSV